MIDRVVQKLGRELREVPVGFKWFVSGLIDGSCCFGGEESAGASFLRRDGTVWSTDKDGLIMVLLAAEIVARTGKDPGRALSGNHRGVWHPLLHAHRRTRDARAEAKIFRAHSGLSQGVGIGRRTDYRQAHPGTRQSRSHRRIESRDEKGWFAARPSGTENIYKIYAESFQSASHLYRNPKRGRANREQRSLFQRSGFRRSAVNTGGDSGNVPPFPPGLPRFGSTLAGYFAAVAVWHRRCVPGAMMREAV